MTNIFRNTCMTVLLAAAAYLIIMIVFTIVMSYGVLALLGYACGITIFWVGMDQLMSLQTKRVLKNMENN